MGIESPLHLIFFAAVALVVLGPKRLPDLAKALGHGIREFRESMTEGEEEQHLATDAPVPPKAPTTPDPPEAPAAPTANPQPAAAVPDASAEASAPSQAPDDAV
jgi:TatA/E family protein of Tat protein translocase